PAAQVDRPGLQPVPVLRRVRAAHDAPVRIRVWDGGWEAALQVRGRGRTRPVRDEDGAGPAGERASARLGRPRLQLPPPQVRLYPPGFPAARADDELPTLRVRLRPRE